jgi:hypothetical protein
VRNRLLGLLALLAGGCGTDGTPPSEAGDLTASYYQAAPGAGALLLTISGGPVESVSGANHELVSFASPFPGTTRVVVAGEFGTGTLLRIRVPDLSRAADYSIQVDQVADKHSFALIDPSGHNLTISR